MIFTGIFLSYLTGCKLVSLFDTRMKINDNFMIIKQNVTEPVGDVTATDSKADM